LTTKVLMKPSLRSFGNSESGIRRVIESYSRYLPQFGFEVVFEGDHDLTATHAGVAAGSDVAHCHGLYWTADYPAAMWEHKANSGVIDAVRHAKEVTVPSAWVAETFARDMHFVPHVVPHGIEWDDWQHTFPHEQYVLWNKNRSADVCDPTPIANLAARFSGTAFITTFAPPGQTYKNVTAIGVRKHPQMKELIQRCGVYLATTKETFGIGILEAMAAGVPVLGYAHGGILELIKHGVNGYLAEPNNREDLSAGLAYCMQHARTLGDNGRELAKQWTWEVACQKVAEVYQLALIAEPPSVTIVIPSFNYGTEDKLGRAIRGALDQTYECGIVVVDDGSDDGGATRELVETYASQHDNVKYIRQENHGVAIARNTGIGNSRSKYVCCLDADDTLDPQFVAACVADLESDRSLGVAYTGLTYVKPNGDTGVSPWPPPYNFDKFLVRQNQIPTCAVFRREMWARLGGYRQRYAPLGAGSEDAEFWVRAGALGYGAKKVTDAGLFIYSWQSGRVSGDPNYREVDWLAWHPWAKDNIHPFASRAAPKNTFAHPVRQADQPMISVIIPVGTMHRKEIINALDSLEAQTFRNWEAILVWDGMEAIPGDDPDQFVIADPDYIWAMRAYPFARFLTINNETKGAGAARNFGATYARSKLLLFLDADDWLYPQALELMLAAYEQTGQIVYSDYVGKAYISPEEAQKLGDRLLNYTERTQEAVIKHYAADFDCDRAQRQPDEIRKDTYIWCLITSLIPKEWHSQINGFDETMPSWEDWDYWIRLARNGRCFYRIPQDLVVYRFYTGQRREAGLHDPKKLLEYMIEKKRSALPMPCNCSGSRKPTPGSLKIIASGNQKDAEMTDTEMVLIRYASGNRGEHKVVGANNKFYGYRKGGDTFLVLKSDQKLWPHLFIPEAVTKPPSEPIAPSRPVQPEPVAPEEVPALLMVTDPQAEIDMQTVPGVTPRIAEILDQMAVKSLNDLFTLGFSGLKQIRGVGESRAEAIMDWVEAQIGDRA